MTLFTARDFKVFDIKGFEERMQAIRTRIRPRLSEIGAALEPELSALVDRPLHVHVAKHARRTVNPPDDTWAALGMDKRGYKKDVHFKVAISRNCLRLLFEVGPDYYDKAEWALRWNRELPQLSRTLGGTRALAWFRDEHDEEPESSLKGWSEEDFRNLGRELTRRRDGQLVLGRRIEAEAVASLGAAGFKKAANGTFRALAPLFLLHEPRALASSA